MKKNQRQTISVILFFSWVVFLLPLFLLSDPSTLSLKELPERFKYTLLPVRFVFKYKSGGRTWEQEDFYRAVVVNTKGLLATDIGKFDEQSPWSFGRFGTVTNFQWQPQYEKPSYATVYMGKELELKAKMVGKSPEFGMVFLQIKPKDLDRLAKKKIQLKPIALTNQELNLGDEVILVSRDLTKELDFNFVVVRSHVDQVLDQPYVSYFLDKLGEEGIMSLVLNNHGDIIGLYHHSRAHRALAKTNPKISTYATAVIPASQLKELFDHPPIEEKKAWFGFMPDSLQFISPDLLTYFGLTKDQKGMRVASVPPQTPVDRSGLKVDDILLKIGTVSLLTQDEKEAAQLSEKLKQFKIGEKVTVNVLRKEKGKYQSLDLSVTTVEEPPKFDDEEEIEIKFLGVKVKDITYDFKYEKQLPMDQHGAVVVFSKAGEPARVAGIEENYIILAVGSSKKNMQDIQDVKSLETLMKKFAKGKPDQLIVKILTSDKDVNYLTLRMTWQAQEQ